MKFLFALSYILLSVISYGQDLNKESKTSHYYYIFKITSREADILYSKGVQKIDSSYLHTLSDSFPVTETYTGKLENGHYIKVKTNRNFLEYSLTTIQNFDVRIIDNTTDLLIQVYDSVGKIIDNASLKIKGKKLKYDKNVFAYKHNKSNKRGLLKVEYQGLSCYYDIGRRFNNSGIKRILKKVVWGSPVKIIWRPVRYFVLLPVDGVKSLIKMRPVGTISQTRYIVRNSVYKVNNLIDKFSINRRYTGYVVFNQPKYKPGDTVRFKAFIVSKIGRPLNKPVHIRLTEGYSKKIFNKELMPYNKGGYEGEFVLQDSLNMTLDKNYQLYFSHIKRMYARYTSGSFNYEDYELNKNKLKIRTDSENQYRNNDLTVSIKGYDENELNLQDARYELVATYINKSEFFDNYVFVPDTLYVKKDKLNPSGETEVVIPDSIFPKANLKYQVTVNMLSSDNEKISKNLHINYVYKTKEIKYLFFKDSVKLWLEENGIRKSGKAEIFYKDKFRNKFNVNECDLPVTIKLNPYYSDLVIKSNEISKNININSETSQLQCYVQRNNDSLFIYVDNPGKLQFSYFLYKQNNEIDKGYGDSLKYTIMKPGNKSYMFALQYLWGGEIISENYGIDYQNKDLKIEVKEPKLICPGENVTIEVKVTDNKGKAVKDVDLTAYSLTEKFGYISPALPEFKKKNIKRKEHINSFHFNDINRTGNQKLNYEQWKRIAGLDSMEYYKFIYPEDGIYMARYIPRDGHTQFSPYVMQNGDFQKIHVIYVDDNPVYFSWMTNIQPYSFRVHSGYHRIKIRLSDTLIVADSIYFADKMKTIFSMNKDYKDTHTIAMKEKNKFDHLEKQKLTKHIFPYRFNFSRNYSSNIKDKYAYITQNDNCIFLNPNKYLTNQLAGPIRVTNVDFKLLDGYDLHFFHEPKFEYDFLPNILKMRERKTDFLFPKYLNNYNFMRVTDDLIMTEKEVKKRYDEYLDQKRISHPRYNNPKKTYENKGSLTIDYVTKNKAEKNPILNIIILKPGDDLMFRIYPGNSRKFYNLEEGTYKLIFLHPDSGYHSADSIFVRSNGLTYKKIYRPELLQKDSFSSFSNEYIRKKIITGKTIYSEFKEKRVIHNKYKMSHAYSGEGYTIEGYVRDDAGVALPGVSIYVKGTTYGTMSLNDGYYSINVPFDCEVLVFSYIGLETTEKRIDSESNINVALMPDECNIEEVVVVAYGVTTKEACTGSVVTVTEGYNYGNIANTLQGKVPGLQLNSSTGQPGSISTVVVRGYSSINACNTPLYVIDGIVCKGNLSKISPEHIYKINVLQGEAATSIYGSRAKNGVIIITTKNNSGLSILKANDFEILDNGNEYDESFFNNISEASKLRTNFSDYAYWQPKLRTDKNGKAEFNVTFPDDITKWKTHVLAVNNKKQTGKAEGSIKSYKPLAARLALPGFLIQGDTAFAIGKSLNYLPDSAKISTSFYLNDVMIFEKDTLCRTSVIDSLSVTTNLTESLKVKYVLKGKNGYFDGEEREIPVFPVGIEKAYGDFQVLDNDTTVNLCFIPENGNVIIYAKADVLDILDDEIGSLIHYVHKCNEQMASKLKAMLIDKQISEFKGRPFKYDKEIKNLIRKLSKHQNDDGLWGWWGKSDTRLWISSHVLEALLKAEQFGYKLNIDKDKTGSELIHQLEKEEYLSMNIISSLKILKSLDVELNYAYFIKKIEESISIQSFYNQLAITEIKQICGLSYDLDWLKSFKRSTMYGNIYFSKNKNYNKNNINYNLNHNDNLATVTAYKILRNDSLTTFRELQKIRNYFFEKRKSGYWRNTYESSKITETILPDLLHADSIFKRPELILSGSLNDTITTFPFEAKVGGDQKLTIIKKGTFPVYLTAYQRYWDVEPKRNEENFIVSSRFNTKDSTNNLKAGEEVNLIVELKVLKDADYVMLDIPIPAGCSYKSKKNIFLNEVHREYRKHKTNIYCQKLYKGEYTFEIELLPRYNGVYSLNPAKAELMYFPTFYGNNEIKKVSIK